MVSLLFLLFDIEIAFIYPGVIFLYKFSFFEFFIFCLFLLTIFLGFIYEWNRGVLEWIKHPKHPDVLKLTEEKHLLFLFHQHYSETENQKFNDYFLNYSFFSIVGTC